MNKKPSRTVFKKEIISEFLAPSQKTKKQKVVILCPGVPGIPERRDVMNLVSRKGFWVFHPRYRGSWESRGKFLKQPLENDILDVIDSLSKGFKDSRSGKIVKIKPVQIFLIGSSFGGPAALLASKDPRISKVVALSAVTDWLDQKNSKENLDYERQYIREYLGRAYDFDDRDWEKLKNGKFYNPMSEVENLDGKKFFILHWKDDEVVRYKAVEIFAKATGAKFWLLKKGGHLGLSVLLDPKISKKIFEFLK